MKIWVTLLSLMIVFVLIPLLQVYGMPPLPGVVTEYGLQLKELRSLEEKPPPKKQLDAGIKYVSVMCSKGKVIVLKWTSNDLACVKEKTAIALEERGWGIPKEKTILLGPECGADFTVFYDVTPPSEAKILKTIRMNLSESDEYKFGQPYTYRWDYITISLNSENSSFHLGMFGDINENSEAKMIIETLKEMPTISDVQFHGAWCY